MFGYLSYICAIFWIYHLTMTEEQNRLLTDFHIRIRELMRFCDKLKADNRQLRQELEQAVSKLKILQQEKDDISLKYENLQIARMLSPKGNQQENKEQSDVVKVKLTNLVQEIDKCLTLLKK